MEGLLARSTQDLQLEVDRYRQELHSERIKSDSLQKLIDRQLDWREKAVEAEQETSMLKRRISDLEVEVRKTRHELEKQ